MKKKRNDVLMVILLIAGFSLLLYPSVSNWWNAQHQSHAIQTYKEDVNNTSNEQKQAMLDEAYAYNTELASKEMNYVLSEEEDQRYRSILDVTGTGIMATVVIPKIRVNLPIYHGTEDSVLQIAVGHVAGSSLPVGGESTHCVLSGHRGLPSSRLFTDLPKVEIGDEFYLQVLDQTLYYEVDQILTVLPDELDALQIEPGQDLCTLVTCTPYGINSHRLLVRGHRIYPTAGEILEEPSQDPNQYLLMSACTLACGILVVLLYRRRKAKAEKYGY